MNTIWMQLSEIKKVGTEETSLQMFGPDGITKVSVGEFGTNLLNSKGELVSLVSQSPEEIMQLIIGVRNAQKQKSSSSKKPKAKGQQTKKQSKHNRK